MAGTHRRDPGGLPWRVWLLAVALSVAVGAVTGVLIVTVWHP